MRRREPDLRRCDSLHFDLGDGRRLVLNRDVEESARRTRAVLTAEELQTFVTCLERLRGDE